MLEGSGAKRGLARRSQVEKATLISPEWGAVGGGELHDQIVGVLTVFERLAVCRLTGLEEVWVAFLAIGEWIKREHAAQTQNALFLVALLPHEHVLGRAIDLALPTLAPRVAIGKCSHPHLHQLPVTALGHLAVHRARLG